jgi:hypothetical protein
MVDKSEEKRPVGRPRCRWDNNIRMDLRKIWWDGVKWIYMAQDTDRWRDFVNTVMILESHQKRIIF